MFHGSRIAASDAGITEVEVITHLITSWRVIQKDVKPSKRQWRKLLGFMPEVPTSASKKISEIPQASHRNQNLENLLRRISPEMRDLCVKDDLLLLGNTAMYLAMTDSSESAHEFRRG